MVATVTWIGHATQNTAVFDHFLSQKYDLENWSYDTAYTALIMAVCNKQITPKSLHYNHYIPLRHHYKYFPLL